MLEVEHIGVISDEMREVVQSEWPELAHKLPPKKSQAWVKESPGRAGASSNPMKEKAREGPEPL